MVAGAGRKRTADGDEDGPVAVRVATVTSVAARKVATDGEHGRGGDGDDTGGDGSVDTGDSGKGGGCEDGEGSERGEG